MNEGSNTMGRRGGYERESYDKIGTQELLIKTNYEWLNAPMVTLSSDLLLYSFIKQVIEKLLREHHG